MKFKFFTLTLFLSLFVVTHVYADDNNIMDNDHLISGYVLDKTAVSLEDGDLALQRNELYLAYDSPWEPQFKIGVRDRYQYDLTQEPEHEIEFRTLTIGQRYDNWSWLLGRQLVTWGKTDGFRLLDTVNPYDYTEFVLDDMNEAKIPLTMLRTDYFLNDNSSFQFLIIPEYRSDKLPSPNDQFYPFPPALAAIQVNKTIEPNTFPISNWQYGAKWEYTGDKLSYTFNYLYKWSSQPIFKFDSLTSTTISQPVREQFIGGSVDFPWRSYVIRSEVLLSPKNEEPALNQYSVPEYAPFASAASVLGIDNFLDNWFLSLQFFFTKFMGNNVEPISGRTQQMYTFLIKHDFDQDKFTIKIIFLSLISQSMSDCSKISFFFIIFITENPNLKNYLIGVKLFSVKSMR